MSTSVDREGRVEQFERKVILRASRSIYLAFAGVATIGILVAALVLLYGLTPSIRGSDPPVPEEPGSQSISPGEVLQRLGPAAVAEGSLETWQPETELRQAISTGSTQEDPLAARLDELLEEIGGYFDQERHPWLSKTRSVCSSKNWYGECIRWRKDVVEKGVLTLLERGSASLAPAARVRFLEGVLAIVKLGEEEETRYLAVRAVADMKAAYGSPPGSSLQALQAVLSTPGKAGEVLPEQGRVRILKTILEIKKRDTPEGVLATFLPQAVRFMLLFEHDEQVAALASLWLVVTDLPPTELSVRFDEIYSTVATVPAEQRSEAIPAYAAVLDEKNDRAAAAHAEAMAVRWGKIQELDSKLAARKSRKSAARMSGLGTILSSLGLIAVIGLFLGLLAVERNTRRMGELVSLLSTRPGLTPEGAEEAKEEPPTDDDGEVGAESAST